MCGWYDYPLRYWLVVPTAWEAYELHTCTPTLIWWGLYNILSKHPVYLRLAWPLVQTYDGKPRPANILPFKWAAPFFGVTAQTSPEAWVALREHRDPFYPLQCVQDERIAPHHHPEWGNYSFFLDQRDDLPGGRTVPETNDARVRRMGTNLSPYNPELPPGREGWATRRTDYTTGNPYMYFTLDDAFMYGHLDQVEVRITYWDHGTDSWRLLYMDGQGQVRAATTAQGENVITKTDSNTWRTVVFHLDDALLTNRLPLPSGGADFYIDSMSDGDEWVHLVEVIKDPAGAPALTPTPPARHYSVPTPTPTPMPPPREVVAPYRTSQITIDGRLDEWPASPRAILSATTASYVDGPMSKADARVYMWATWDEQALTFAFRVYDDKLVADSIDIWRDDSIEIGLDADNDHQFTWGGADFQFTLAVNGRWARLGRDSEDPTIKRAVQRLSDGWSAEVQFPWSTLRVPAGTPGRILGFNFAYHDDDDGYNWDVYMIWAGKSTNTSDASYGHLILARGTAVTPTPVPPRWATPIAPPSCYRRIWGKVYTDSNQNGRWDAGEPGLPGIPVLLQGPISSMITTRDNGTYMFVGIPPGDYWLSVTVPEGKQATTANPRSLVVSSQQCIELGNVDVGISP